MARLSKAYKEVRKTSYWIRLLQATDYLLENQAQSVLNDAESSAEALLQRNKPLILNF